MKHLLKNILSIMILLFFTKLTVITASEMEYLESSTNKFSLQIKGPRDSRDYLTKILKEQNKNNYQDSFILPSIKLKQELIKITAEGRVFLNVEGLSKGAIFFSPGLLYY